MPTIPQHQVIFPFSKDGAPVALGSPGSRSAYGAYDRDGTPRILPIGRAFAWPQGVLNLLKELRGQVDRRTHKPKWS